jgi:hypothetical protein
MNGLDLKYASRGMPPPGVSLRDDTLQNDKEVVLAAVTQNGRALEYASKHLRDDPDVCYSAVNQNGFALRYASALNRDNEKVVLAAAQQNPRSFQWASPGVRNIKPVVLQVLRMNGFAFQWISHHLQSDQEVIDAAIEGGRLDLAEEEKRGDHEIVMSAVKKCGRSLRFASDAMRMNVEVVKAACGQDGMSLKYARANLKVKAPTDNDLQNNREIVEIAINENEESLQHASFVLQLEMA